jgi:hypothetical protein
MRCFLSIRFTGSGDELLTRRRSEDRTETGLTSGRRIVFMILLNSLRWSDPLRMTAREIEWEN